MGRGIKGWVGVGAREGFKGLGQGKRSKGWVGVGVRDRVKYSGKGGLLWLEL